MMELLQAIILGMVEGVTEFLPISSTGHLIVVQKLMGFQDTERVFTVVIQFGAIAAVIWYFRQDLWQKTVGLVRREREAINFWKIMAIGTVPAGIAGLLLDSSMDTIATATVVGAALILGGFVLLLIERHRPTPPRAEIQLGKITNRQAIIVGLSQCIALIPGVSRSGATIVGGMQAGLNRPTAAAYAFYLSIPVMVLASGYKLIKYSGELGNISGGVPALVLGVVSAFLTALLAISWLLKYISKHNFTAFGYYRIVVGLIILLVIA